MANEPSWQDFYDVGKTTLQTRRPGLKVEIGDVTDAILAACASMATAIVAYATAKVRQCFLDGAVGDALTTLAHDRGVDRRLGSGAIGTIRLFRASAALGAGTITAGSRFATTPDATGTFATFTIDSDVVFGPADLIVSNIPATCTSIGKIGNVGSNTINRVLDSLFDPSIQVTNSVLAGGSAFAGGEEEESDEDLRDRVRGFFLTQARGTIEALVYGAKTVDGVKRVSIVVDSAGNVTLYVADEDGNSNSAMVAAVEAEIENWRAAGDVVYVTAGVIYLQAVEIALTVRTGTNVAALLDRVRQAIISRLLRLNPGETLYRSAISAAVRDVDRENIIEVEVINPPANIVPSANELIRTNNGLITAS